MLNREVLTYKRRRVSSKSNLVHHVETTNSCSASQTPTPSKPSCLEAGPTSFTKEPSGDNLFVGRIHGQKFEGSRQLLSPMHTILEKGRSTEESAMQQREFRSSKSLLSSEDLVNDSSCKASTPAVHALSNKLSEAVPTDDSSSIIPNVESLPGFKRDQSTEPGLFRDVCFVSATETSCDPNAPDIVHSAAVNMNEKADITCNNKNAKGKFHLPWITFSRRVKRGKATNEKLTHENQKAETKQPSEDTSSDQATSRSSQNLTRIFADRICHGISCNEQGIHLGYQHLLPHDVKGLSKEVTAEPVAEEFAESLQIQNHKQLLASDNSSVLADSLCNGLSNVVSNLEKAGMSRAHKERNGSGNLELSAAPSMSCCLDNAEPTTRTTCSRNTGLPRFTEAAQETTESAMLSTSSSSPMLLHEATIAKSNGLEWLESLDRALRVPKRAKRQSGIVNESAVNCRQASNGNGLTISPILLCSRNSSDKITKDVSRDPFHGSTSAQDRVFLTKSGGSVTRLQHRGTQKFSSAPTDFVGLSLPLNPGATSSTVKEFKNPRSVANGNNNVIHGSHSLGQFLDEYSSHLRHQQAIDNMMTGPWLLKERQTSLFDNFRRYSVDWTEDELDSLWIGVRRHGVENWNSMLKDPKLLFSETRVAADLAERWKLEQRKIFSATFTEHVQRNRPERLPYAVLVDALASKSIPGNYYGGYGDCSSVLQRDTTETRLSLGDVYVQKQNITKRRTFPSPALNTAEMHMCDFPSEALSQIADRVSNGRIYPPSGIRIGSYGKCHEIGYFSGQTSNERQSNGSQATNLPHWLKEDVSVCSVLCDPELLNNDQHTLHLFPGEPSAIKDPLGRGVLKRKVPHSSRSHTTEPPPAEASPLRTSIQYENSTKDMHDNNDLDCIKGMDLNKKISGIRRSNELAVINGSASSEETISDRSED